MICYQDPYIKNHEIYNLLIQCELLPRSSMIVIDTRSNAGFINFLKKKDPRLNG